jgi:gliding motility-associated transport system permease protein
MRNLPSLALREWHTLFFSPLAYVILSLLLLFCGLVFYGAATQTAQATETVEVLTKLLGFLFLLGTPLLTMRLLSEEYRSGSIEYLMTAPVTDAEVVVAKFLGAYMLYVCLLIPTLIYPLLLDWVGDPDWGIILATYVGLLVMGAQVVALGVLCSGLTRNQIIASVLAIVIQIMLWIIGPIAAAMLPKIPELTLVALYAGGRDHLTPFIAGRIAVRDIVYFLTLTWLWLFLAVRVVESRRWR